MPWFGFSIKFVQIYSIGWKLQDHFSKLTTVNWLHRTARDFEGTYLRSTNQYDTTCFAATAQAVEEVEFLNGMRALAIDVTNSSVPVDTSNRVLSRPSSLPTFVLTTTGGTLTNILCNEKLSIQVGSIFCLFYLTKRANMTTDPCFIRAEARMKQVIKIMVNHTTLTHFRIAS
jgi:hypothetical protein